MLVGLFGFDPTSKPNTSAATIGLGPQLFKIQFLNEPVPVRVTLR
ncbi:MAG: hypothetical protein SXG53_10390 [Pseudomonadota bacterium]|nr:hypothetical protein [Pseudomonadota bacterium]